MTYATKLEHSNLIRDKFSEIKVFRDQLFQNIDDNDAETYDYNVSIIFGKISVIEKTIINLKKAFLNDLEETE